MDIAVMVSPVPAAAIDARDRCRSARADRMAAPGVERHDVLRVAARIFIHQPAVRA